MDQVPDHTSPGKCRSQRAHTGAIARGIAERPDHVAAVAARAQTIAETFGVDHVELVEPWEALAPDGTRRTGRVRFSFGR